MILTRKEITFTQEWKEDHNTLIFSNEKWEVRVSKENPKNLEQHLYSAQKEELKNTGFTTLNLSERFSDIGIIDEILTNFNQSSLEALEYFSKKDIIRAASKNRGFYYLNLRNEQGDRDKIKSLENSLKKAEERIRKMKDYIEQFTKYNYILRKFFRN